ncbi:WhiB family transcriptional regulator [Pseudolysinimonas sp.]
MSRATDAYGELTRAMSKADVACLGDDRFVEDGYPLDELTPICHRCPLLAACRDYAAVAKPKGGVWAGRRWGGA